MTGLLTGAGRPDTTTAPAGLGRRLLHHQGFVVGLIGVVALLIVAVVGPSLVGDPDATSTTRTGFTADHLPSWLVTPP